MPRRLTDLTGKRFGRLTVIERADDYVSVRRGKDGRLTQARSYTRRRCTCDCGNETEVLAQHLMHGGTKSCGCLRTEKLLERMGKL